MVTTIDCRDIECPAPVLKTKQAIEKRGVTDIRVIVDNDAAVENVTRFLNYMGFETLVEAKGTESIIQGKSCDKAVKKEVDYTKEKNNHSSDARSSFQQDQQKIMVMVGASVIGRGDDQLGEKLMTNFLKTLKEMGRDLWRLVFVNKGVSLTIKGAGVLPILKELEENKTHILVCGACLTHFGLMDKKQVGETTNMLDIVTSMQLADKVINL